MKSYLKTILSLQSCASWFCHNYFTVAFEDDHVNHLALNTQLTRKRNHLFQSSLLEPPKLDLITDSHISLAHLDLALGCLHQYEGKDVRSTILILIMRYRVDITTL